jgi:ubiquinone/menaquinone biosynthesis C-methylase UbiE
MSWYDVFSFTYDAQLEQLYRPYRSRAVSALGLFEGASGLDLACGTGQSFDALREGVGATGRVIGLDASSGMLRRARRRIARAGWDNVSVVKAGADEVSPELLGAPDGLDFVLCCLGATAFPDWPRVFARTFDLLRPGGRYVVFDVHAAERLFQTRMVELIARADLSRRAWEPLEAACADLRVEELDGDPKTFGGTLFVASGTRPR